LVKRSDRLTDKNVTRRSKQRGLSYFLESNVSPDKKSKTCPEKGSKKKFRAEQEGLKKSRAKGWVEMNERKTRKSSHQKRRKRGGRKKPKLNSPSGSEGNHGSGSSGPVLKGSERGMGTRHNRKQKIKSTDEGGRKIRNAGRERRKEGQNKYSEQPTTDWLNS